jgi:hypothetical protein
MIANWGSRLGIEAGRRTIFSHLATGQLAAAIEVGLL